MTKNIGDKLEDTTQHVRDEANVARGRLEQAIKDAKTKIQDDDDAL